MGGVPDLSPDRVYKSWEQMMDVFEQAPDVITNTVGSQNWCHALDLPTWEIG